MEPSLPGLIVCCALLMLGWFLRAPMVIALFASLPLGSTAFGTLTSLGGSTPLVFTLIATLLVVVTMSQRNVLHDLGIIFRSKPAAWIVLGLLLYAILGTVLLPRLFAGQTTAFIIFRGSIVELPLAPTSGNITQTGYFALGILTFYATSLILLQPERLREVYTGFIVYIALSIVLGIVDLLGKLAGFGDVLLGIRTANYSLLTEVSAGGFWRIVGAYPEASSFAIGMLSCLAFALVHWRTTGSRLSLVLAGLSFVLVVLSTSTTAYAGLGVLGAVYGFDVVRRLVLGRFSNRDIALAVCVPVLLVGVLTIYVGNEKALDPVVQLIDTIIINKAQSASGQERAYWNERSLASISDTYGLGVGLGSSRASSWFIAVVSQFGIPGALLLAFMVIELLRSPGQLQPAADNKQIIGFYRGVRACALAFMVGGALSGGAADPGILFFMCLAVMLSSRQPRGAKEHMRYLTPQRRYAY